MPKKIIIVGPAYPYRGGNSLFVSYVYDILKDHFDVKILNYKLLYPSFLFPGTTQFDKSTEQIKQAPSERIVNSINPVSWYKTAKRINKENPDLIVFDWWHPFFGPCHFSISSLIKKDLRKRIVFITENFVSHEGSPIDRILTKIGLSNASSFIALSAKVEKELNDEAKGRRIYRSELPVYECYSGENISNEEAKRKLGFNKDNKVLLFFGYVRKYKGLDILIDSFPKVLKDIPEARLLIVGEFYDDPGTYLKQISDLKIEDRVTLINRFVANEEVGQYYLASDLVILPYRSATQSGILNVAYGFLKPVLVTNVGGLAEFVKEKETGIIISPGSPDAIYDGIKEFFNLKGTVNFEEKIKQFTGSNKFEQMPELFNTILKDIKE